MPIPFTINTFNLLHCFIKIRFSASYLHKIWTGRIILDFYIIFLSKFECQRSVFEFNLRQVFQAGLHIYLHISYTTNIKFSFQLFNYWSKLNYIFNFLNHHNNKNNKFAYLGSIIRLLAGLVRKNKMCIEFRKKSFHAPNVLQ